MFPSMHCASLLQSLTISVSAKRHILNNSASCLTVFFLLCSSDLENMEERLRYERMVSESLQADPEQQEQSGRRKPALVR